MRPGLAAGAAPACEKNGERPRPAALRITLPKPARKRSRRAMPLMREKTVMVASKTGPAGSAELEFGCAHDEVRGKPQRPLRVTGGGVEVRSAELLLEEHDQG